MRQDETGLKTTRVAFFGLVLVVCLPVLAEGEVCLRYQFDEIIGGAVTDVSGHGNDPKVYVKAGEAAFIQTAAGDALRLAALEDRIEAPFKAFPGARGSLQMRVRFDTLDGRQTLWRIYSKTGDGMSLTLHPKGFLRLAYYERSLKKWTSCQFAAGLLREKFWHDIVAGWDFARGMSLSLDGTIRAVVRLGMKPHFAADDSVMIFGNEHVFTSPLRGAIRLIEMTTEPPDAPVAERAAIEPGEPIAWETGELRLTFEDRYGSLTEARWGSVKLAEADEFAPLWQVHLRGERGLGIPVTVGPECAPPVQISRDGDEVLFEWREVPMPRDKARLAVRVRIAPGPEKHMSSWRIEVDNPSTVYGIWEVHFPILALCPLSSDLAGHRLLVPLRWGEARPDPFAVTEKTPPPEIHYRCNYPGAHMQFAAVASAEHGATYLATYDGDAKLKETWLRIVPRRKRIVYHVKQFPDNVGEPGENYVQTYQFVLGHVAGDWYDVCRTYRRWATKQRWAALGPLHQREDIPDWYKNSAIVLRQSLTSRGSTVGPNLENSLRCARELPGARMSIWYGWNEVDSTPSAVPLKRPGEPSLSAGAGWLWEPADGVADAVRQMADAGLYPTAYINTRLYDRTTDWKNHPYAVWALPFVIRDVTGQPAFYQRELNLWDMCRWTAGWQERYCANCEVAMRAGFRGIYLDSFGRGNSMCFAAKEHGHLRGGGNLCVEAQRRFAKVVRQRIRKIFPEAVTTGEAQIEAFIDVLDGKLLHYNLPRNFAPLYTAVYHDYQLCYGRTVSDGSDHTEPRFSMIVGRLFVEGVQIGRMFINSPEFFLWKDEYRPQLEYLKRCAEAKIRASDYLSLGEFMRPPVIETRLPALETDYRGAHTVMPAVLIRAWRAPDGTVAHVLTNISADAHQIAYRFSTHDYGFPKGARVRLRQIFPDEPEDEQILRTGECVRSLHLDDHDVRVFELRVTD